MKKQVSVLAMMLTVLMLCVSFAGCDLLESVKQKKEEENKQELFKDLKIEDTFEDGKPYHLYFISNGDGTCALKYVTTDPSYTQDFVLEIPEKSPAGDIVTSIDMIPITRHSSRLDAPSMHFPYVLTAATMEELCATAKANGISDFDYAKLTAYFLKCSTEGVEEDELKALLSFFPILVESDIYLFDANASQTEMNKVYGYLLTFCEWDAYKYQQSLEAFMELAKRSDSVEQAELYLTALRSSEANRIVGISIPKTVSAIDNHLWVNLENLQTVTVAEDNPTLKMIDDCLIDTATGTLLLYKKNTGKIPEDLGITVIEKDAFADFCPELSEPDPEGCVVRIELPQGVTTTRGLIRVPFSRYGEEYGDTADFMYAHVVLPDSLEEFYVTLGEDNYCFEYEGTMAEWEERVTCYNDDNPDGHPTSIKLKTSDSDGFVLISFVASEK